MGGGNFPYKSEEEDWKIFQILAEVAKSKNWYPFDKMDPVPPLSDLSFFTETISISGNTGGSTLRNSREISSKVFAVTC